MPSVLYTVPLEQGQAALGKIDGFRKSFGNVQSFASNHGFTKDFKEIVDSGRHSHAEQLDFFGEQETIRNNLKGEDDFRTMPTSLPELRQQILRFQRRQKDHISNTSICPDRTEAKSLLYPDGSLPHNEVVARLYLWDSVAVDVGADVKEGLSAAIELQVARESLCIELQSQRTDHPLFDSFLRQQCSVGTGNTTMTLGQTNARYGNLSDADKNHVLTQVLQKLEEPIAVCNYSPASSSIRGLCESEVTGTDLLDALDQVIKARTGSAPPRQESAKAMESRIRAQR
ncbi:MAG: hypothetical protein H7315_05545 [Herminiimonas sp.]|nr:hypothetical protein [Herminiimonas sp.]